MMTKINYQPWLQAVLTIAKHYRIEPSEERVRLQLDWNQNQNLDEILLLMSRQVGLNLCKVSFTEEMINPWRLPILVEFKDGQVGVVDKADSEGNVSVPKYIFRASFLLNENTNWKPSTVAVNLVVFQLPKAATSGLFFI